MWVTRSAASANENENDAAFYETPPLELASEPAKASNSRTSRSTASLLAYFISCTCKQEGDFEEPAAA
jgi:hypothetical protein